MLKYIGNGAWLPGVPARDLLDSEVLKYGDQETLIASGLYETPRRDRQKSIRHSDIEEKEEAKEE